MKFHRFVKYGSSRQKPYLKYQQTMGSGNRRVCMYPKDVQIIMGKEYTQARLYLIKIKKHLKKESHQFISFEEFSKFSGLPLDEIMRNIL